MEHNERFAYITCSECEQTFQVLLVGDDEQPYDWDEQATAALYHDHLESAEHAQNQNGEE